MNDKFQEKFIKAVKSALSTFCRTDENGIFYSEIYADYRDELSKENLVKICEDKNPREKFWEILDEGYCETVWDEEDAIIKRVLEDEDVAKLAVDQDEDEIRELIREEFYIKYPEKHFLRTEVLVDLILDTGDMNDDFASNMIGGHYNARDNSIPDESSLLWLARQQGYKKSDLKKVFADCGKSESPLLKSIWIETANCASSLNALVFLAKMTLEEYLNLLEAINIESKKNESYYLSERKGRGYIILAKDSVCGLYDRWNGSGSVLEITLEKDVRLPFRCLCSAKHDGCWRYNIQNIYGCDTSLWHDNAIKEIHPMKKAA